MIFFKPQNLPEELHGIFSRSDYVALWRNRERARLRQHNALDWLHFSSEILSHNSLVLWAAHWLTQNWLTQNWLTQNWLTRVCREAFHREACHLAVHSISSSFSDAKPGPIAEPEFPNAGFIAETPIVEPELPAAGPTVEPDLPAAGPTVEPELPAAQYIEESPAAE